MNAFFLRSIPERYHDLEILSQRLRSGGANTVITRLPRKNGDIHAATLTNLIFLSHQNGLRVYVVLPTRFDRRALVSHPEWEDIRYDPRTGKLHPDGSLDLANPEAVMFLVQRVKEVAAFSVDGILLDEDFGFGITDGMGSSMLKEFTRRYGSPFDARKVFEKISTEISDADINAFDKSFWQWSELKKDVIANSVLELSRACRGVQGMIKFGIPLRTPGGETPQLSLARFSYDMKALKKLDVDFYWAELRSAEDAVWKGGKSYNKDLEYFSRMVKSVSSVQKEQEKNIIVIPATASGKALPMFALEEITFLVQMEGKTTGIAYLMDQTAVPSDTLTKKLFKRE